MPVKLRLQRKGRGKRPFYFIVAADSRAPRDGKFIEHIGSYNPTTIPATIDLDRDKALDWLDKGAQPTNTVRAILGYKGVLYKKHLMRGVKKGAFTLEEAEAQFAAWIAGKEDKIISHKSTVENTILLRRQDREAQEAQKRAEKAASLQAELSQNEVESAEETADESAAAAHDETSAAQETNTPEAEESQTEQS